MRNWRIFVGLLGIGVAFLLWRLVRHRPKLQPHGWRSRLRMTSSGAVSLFVALVALILCVASLALGSIYGLGFGALAAFLLARYVRVWRRTCRIRR
jgi:hypothetical protein